MDHLVTNEPLEFVHEIQLPQYMKQPKREVYQDTSGNWWMMKHHLFGDEALREFVGYHLIHLFQHCNVRAQRIRMHPDSSHQYFVEFPFGLEPYHVNLCSYEMNEHPERIPSWVQKHQRSKDWINLTKPLTRQQKQHIVACIVNDDNDRHLYTYAVQKKLLYVLDQDGGTSDQHGNLRGGATMLKGARILSPHDTVGMFAEGIAVLRKAMQEGYYTHIFAHAFADERKLKQMVEHTTHLEDILQDMIAHSARN